MGAFLLTAGAKGKRFCLPNSRVMIHQPLGGYQGQATDIEIHAREILKVKGRMNELMDARGATVPLYLSRAAQRCKRLAPENGICVVVCGTKNKEEVLTHDR